MTNRHRQKIGMIVTDLDGTLLKTDKTISDYTKSILEKCKQSGIKLVYATGRGSSAETLASSVLFDGKVMVNGAIAKVGNELVYKCVIPYQVAQPILIACDKRGMQVASELGSMHYSNFVVAGKWAHIFNYKIVDLSHHELDAEKIYSPDTTPSDVQFIEQLLPDNLYAVKNMDESGLLVSIMHKDATKSKAVAELASIWGILPENIVAFGDEENDIDLLQYAGTGIAVDNALDVVKQVATYVCRSNDEDGIARWLEENVL